QTNMKEDFKALFSQVKRIIGMGIGTCIDWICVSLYNNNELTSDQIGEKKESDEEEEGISEKRMNLLIYREQDGSDVNSSCLWMVLAKKTSIAAKSKPMKNKGKEHKEQKKSIAESERVHASFINGGNGALLELSAL
ncbi:hypothetical protein ACJX0J_000637, partial (mitochondrion) [Zea mays]